MVAVASAHLWQLEDLGNLVGDVHDCALLLRADVVDLADLALQMHPAPVILSVTMLES